MTQQAPRRRWQDIDGVLLLDKAGGMTSNDALQKARRLFSAAKGGHTGTLDPMATGLLPLCFGEATKFSNRLLEADKTYLARLLLGVTTTTADAEGDVLREREVCVSEGEVVDACKRFLGEIRQLPPMYSALKHEGKALYEYARQGVEIAREERLIRIISLTVTRVSLPEVDIEVRCSKGTYVRTLAEDIGEVLGCGAHLIALRRTAIGPLDMKSAVTLEGIGAVAESERHALLLPADSLLAHLPAVALDSIAERAILHGQSAMAATENELGEVRLYGSRFLGLGLALHGGEVKPVRLVATGKAN